MRSYKGRFVSRFGDAKSEFLNYLFYTIGEDYHGAFTLTPAADGKSATLRLQLLEPLDDLPAGEHSARFSTTTYKENFEISKSGDFPFTLVKE